MQSRQSVGWLAERPAAREVPLRSTPRLHGDHVGMEVKVVAYGWESGWWLTLLRGPNGDTQQASPYCSPFGVYGAATSRYHLPNFVDSCGVGSGSGSGFFVS
ncbi:hypothetical protein Vretimale_17122 [Volvox reticuliferus]|uniref:Uncharacterized protein n=1 Tax=Volvox reticuliferus TaxID=1737510 RepID=A0A8J4GVM7_9CHLO|nr:hypothetical protein Vretifemale_18626 [Volvox reticuliferus]GIM14092.1 hypothetical protein Vretimale_17122 [Volvox reticuliferus]